MRSLSETTPPSSLDQPWQLEMFDRSLKKTLKLQALLQMTGKFSESQCLFITCGDNNGALNWHFRNAGGHWVWADVEGGNVVQISQLLGETVHQLDPVCFPFQDDHFDTIICIDVLEHLSEDQVFLGEIRRVLRPGGLALVTVPNGDPRLLANRMKTLVGMTPAVYGHTRSGYTVQELSDALSRVGFSIQGSSGYSRFFTEMVELAINFMYVKVLGSREMGSEVGQIAPTTSEELKTHGMAYRLYSFVFPLMKVISGLDRFLPASSNNAVIVAGSKEREESS
jgi:SAM-dependent methyltransferase